MDDANAEAYIIDPLTGNQNFVKSAEQRDLQVLDLVLDDSKFDTLFLRSVHMLPILLLRILQSRHTCKPFTKVQ